MQFEISDLNKVNSTHLEMFLEYISLYKINGKFFNSLEDCERHLKQFFAQKEKVLGGWNYEVAWKMAEGSGTKLNTLVKKVLSENEKQVFYSRSKTEGTFWPMQYFFPQMVDHTIYRSL